MFNVIKFKVPSEIERSRNRSRRKAIYSNRLPVAKSQWAVAKSLEDRA